MWLLAKLFGKRDNARPARDQATVGGMDQWTAGGLALQIIVRWMIDGSDARRTRDFIKWLSVGDVIQTEHLIILCALQSLETSGDELSIDALRARLSTDDPAGFLVMVLNQMIESRLELPSEGSRLDEFRGVLTKLRERRQEQLEEAKRAALDIARRVLRRQMNVIDAAQKFQSIEHEFRYGEGRGLEIFSRITSATSGHPRVEQRKHWAADALARVERECAELEERTRPEVELACRKLIEQWTNGMTSMWSPNLAATLALRQGKYVRWANQLNADSLEALLWAIGEFGRRWTAAIDANGCVPEPNFHPHYMAEDRMRNALKALAKLQSGGRLNLDYGPPGLSEHETAFSPEFRERLSRDPHTAWAQGLDEDSAGLLLWMVGEYGIRVNSSRGPNGEEYPPPTFTAAPEITIPMRTALQLIAKFERGEAISAAEVSRRIANREG